MQEVSGGASVEKGDRIPWGWVVITAVGLIVAAMLAAFVWVGIYSTLIHPGEELPFYQNYAQFAAPIVSVVVGIPLWFFACRWLGRKAGRRAVAASLAAWAILPIIDIPLTLLAQGTAYNWMMLAISESTKLLAAYLGGRAALKYVLGSRRAS